MKALLLHRKACYSADMKERIIQLESIAAMQDETIASLNSELFRQQQDIARLQRRVEVLEQKLSEIKPSEDIAENEKPPHY